MNSSFITSRPGFLEGVSDVLKKGFALLILSGGTPSSSQPPLDLPLNPCISVSISCAGLNNVTLESICTYM